MIIKLIKAIKGRHINKVNRGNQIRNNRQYQNMINNVDAQVNAMQKAAIR